MIQSTLMYRHTQSVRWSPKVLQQPHVKRETHAQTHPQENPHVDGILMLY